MSELKGTLRKLTPTELSVVKGQIAAMLNYTKQGGSVAKLPKEIRDKVAVADRARIVVAVAKKLGA